MKHLDEGTIHAWIDGALDAEAAREVEAHARECSECAAAVAEARGLVAASSRILNALDDVPSGVVPKAAPATIVAGKPAAPSKPKRQWRAAPWVTGIAATLVLAIGVNQWQEDERARDTASSELPSAPPAVSVTPSETRLAPLPDSVARPTDGVRSRAANQVVADQAAASRVSPPPAAASRVSPPAAANEAAFSAERPRAAADSSVAKAQAPMAADRAMTAAQDTTRLRSPLTVRLDEIVVTSMSQANQLAGCYRVPRETVAGGAALGSVGAAATEQRDARARSASPAQRREFSLAPAAAPLLRLDTSSFMGGFRVKPQAGDSTVGWWTQASADSLSVRFLDGTRATVARSQRVDCP